MIQLTCTHCRAMLEMDDGFAGGACRCKHCGTIQTVPSRLKNKGEKSKESKTLYKNRPATIGAQPSSGLDQLADIVASSGLQSNRLRKTEAETLPAAAKPKNVKLLLIGAGVLIALLIGVVIYLATRGTNSATEAKATNGQINAPSVATKPANPNFCGLPLEGSSVVYVLDRGDSMRDSFAALKAATMKSVASLGPDRKFQIVFWNNGTDDAFPKEWPKPATDENISAVRSAIEDVPARGKTDIKSAMKIALATDPTEVVIVTAKAWDLDDAFVKVIDKARGSKGAKIHTIALSDPGASTALQQVAAKGRGTFKLVTEEELKEVGK